jgi:tetratricopeptide (TPR) repeat protein
MRACLLIAIAWIVGSTAAADPAGTLTEAIEELDRSDPASPAALNMRLEYADFLVAAHGAGCQQRLDEAQAQLDAAAADPAFEVVLPNGLARQADLEYRIHTARASCGSDPSQRQNDLHQGLAAAQRAVDLYRDALDYQSMAIMQFNVGATQRLLGNDTAAVAALRSTIDMDREYGFRDDAADNYKLLAQWTGTPNDPPPTVSPPARTTTLKFGWSICNAHVAMDMTYIRVADGGIVRSRGIREFERAYRSGWSNWQVSNEPGHAALSIPQWPQGESEWEVVSLSLESALLRVPDIEISKSGDFAHAMGLYGLSSKLSKATRTLLHGRVSPELAHDIDLSFAPDAIEGKAAEDYNFDTGIWVGATLEQGVWYEMSAPLIMPGTFAVTVSHDIEFAFTRQVPCNPDSTERSCVELVIHAAPEADALEGFAAGLASIMRLPQGKKAHLWSETYMRIVTDPNTLMTHVRDVRHYWHVSYDGANLQDVANQSERILVTQSIP